ncbi:MAG: aldo/keto reductase [Caldilineales bacterium]|nr:aldo/keto reductase [Caldilineales bacterium]
MSNEITPMRMLGKSTIAVSEIGFGLWAAGGDSWGATDDQDILDAIDYTLDRGVNFYDTADVYGGGHSEELLGRAMQGRRQRFVVATKIGWRDFDGAQGRSAYTTIAKLIAGVESNLQRLQTDYIDIIQSHIDFRDPTMEIFLEGFQRLQRAGKVRAYGVSTSHFDYLQAFNAGDGCATLQIDYSILNRTPEAEILPYCQAHNIGVIVRGALAMGILTGKYTADTRFGEDDWRRRWHENEEEYQIYLQDLATVEQLRALTQERSLAQLALQFTLAHPAVSTVIPGIKNLRQAEANLMTAQSAPLAAAELTQIDALVPPGGGRKIWPA